MLQSASSYWLRHSKKGFRRENRGATRTQKSGSFCLRKKWRTQCASLPKSSVKLFCATIKKRWKSASMPRVSLERRKRLGFIAIAAIRWYPMDWLQRLICLCKHLYLWDSWQLSMICPVTIPCQAKHPMKSQKLWGFHKKTLPFKCFSFSSL